MKLRDFVSEYISDHPYGLRESSKVQIRSAVQSFARWLGRDPLIADLDRDTVNRWTDYLTQQRRHDTVRTTRGTILTLWRAAADAGHCEPPAKIRRLRKIQRDPQAWTAEQIVDLVNTIDPPGAPPKSRLHPKLRNGAPKKLWFASLILVAYDTGIRLGDLLTLRWCDLHFKRGAEKRVELRIRTSKTGDTVFRVLNSSTVQRLEDYRRAVGGDGDARIWPLWGRREAFYRAIRKLVEQAGLDSGTFRYLRRAAVTQSDIVQFGTGQKIAGHRDARVTTESYRDQAQLGRDPIAAPDLWEAAKRENRQAS